MRSAGGAGLGTTTSGDGTRGLVFPHYARRDEQRLVLVLAPVGATRQTAPTNRLVFGADVKLDRSAGSSPQDNGDNVVQRGLYADDNQFKLQVDRQVPSCTVRTPRSRVVVELGRSIGDRWYRLSCQYDGVTLDLTAEPLEDPGEPPTVVSVQARAGALSFPSSTSVSVGGKVTSGGDLVKNESDKFNGVLDNVVVSPGL